MTLLPAAGKPHERSSPVVGVGASLDQSGVFHSVEPLGHPARGEERCTHQARRVELVGCAGTAERGEEVEPSLLQPVLLESLGELLVGEVDDAEEPAVNAERSDVQLGTLPAPLRDDLVHVVVRPAHGGNV